MGIELDEFHEVAALANEASEDALDNDIIPQMGVDGASIAIEDEINETYDFDPNK